MSDINTLADVVRVNGAGLPDRIALVQAGRDSVTWAQLLERSARIAQALADAGVGAGDRVAFLDKNSVEHFDVSFGAAMLNAVSVDVNWRLAAPEVQFIVDDAAATVLIVGPDFVPVLDAIVDQLPKVTKFVVIGGHPDHEDYDEWMARYPADDPGAQAAAGDVAFQLYSSGTTGRPKGVMLSNHNLFALLPMARDMWGIQRDSVNLVAMPLFHIGGGGWAVAGMYEGATSVIVRDIDPAALIRTIESERVTHAFLVPAVLQFMLMVPGVDDCRLLEPRDDRLRRLADQRRDPGQVRRHVQVQVLAGVRPDRDDRRRRQPRSRGSRHDRSQPASPAVVRPARPWRRVAHRR